MLYFILFPTLLFTSCKQQVSGLQGTNLAPNMQSGSCMIGRWSNGALPLDLKLSPEIVADFTAGDIVGGLNPIDRMAKVWADALTPTLTLFQLPMNTASGNGSANLTNYRDSEVGIYKSHAWFSNISSSALAITQFYGIIQSNATLGTYLDLTHADIILNYRDFGSDFTYNGNSFIDYDVPTIVLHEMGHLLGLCHETNHNSIMAPYYFTTQRTLKAFDTSKIQALYLNNQNYAMKVNDGSDNALSAPVGTEVKGVVELNANGICKHYINGKLVYQHIEQ